MPTVNPADVPALADGDVDVVVPLITTLAKSYTRGQGFTGNVPTNADIEAVIVTASARLAANGSQLRQGTTAGIYTQDLRSSFEGWTLAELAVLNRYRKRAM